MENKKINVQIVQPVVPKYRVPLFDALIQDNRFNVFIMAATEEPAGVKSVETSCKNIDLRYQIKTFFRKIMWQKDLYLLECMKDGDVLIINGNIKYFSNYPLILKAKRKKVSVIWWGHGWSSTTSKLSFYIRKNIIKLIADTLLLYTSKEKELFIKNGFIDNKVFYMNNTIYTQEIESIKKSITKEDIKIFKKKNRLESKKILLFVGRLRMIPPTNIELLLKVLVDLSEDYKLIIIGDGEAKNSLINLSEKLNIKEKVLFLGAIYEEKKLAHWFLSADCFVYPGTIGLSLLHSFAYGLPIVTHNSINAHGPEIAALKDGINGSMFIKNNKIDLSNKIQKILYNKEYYSKNTLETIKYEYSYASMISKVKDCIIKSSNKDF